VNGSVLSIDAKAFWPMIDIYSMTGLHAAQAKKQPSFTPEI